MIGKDNLTSSDFPSDNMAEKVELEKPLSDDIAGVAKNEEDKEKAGSVKDYFVSCGLQYCVEFTDVNSESLHTRTVWTSSCTALHLQGVLQLAPPCH